MAAARKSAGALTAVARPGTTSYKVGPFDVLEVSVFNVPELSKTVQVAGSGTVGLPLVGELPAAGRTAQEIERDLTKRLGAKYLQNPQVTVLVKEYNSQRITLEGAVKKPGVYPIRGELTLLQAVATAGGFGDNADSNVVVFRTTAKGKRSAARFDVEQIRNGSIGDPKLAAGDVVVASSSALKEGFNNVVKALPLLGVFALL